MNYDSEGLSYYEGDWVVNKRHGFGTCCYPSGNVYEGLWFNDRRHGEGRMQWLDSEQMYSGQWQNGIQVSTSVYSSSYFGKQFLVLTNNQNLIPFCLLKIHWFFIV